MKWWQDVSERALATAIQVVLAAITTDMLYAWFAGFDDDYRTLVVMGIAAALAVVKGAVARKLGDPDSASLVD